MSQIANSRKEEGTDRPTLSACMIVKNEEKFLPQCLESIKDVVDEIIVVDTGSTDRTVEIAQSYGAKVYHHPWNNDFSKARNTSLRYAAGDWILVMDADEELEREDIPLLRQCLQSDENEAILFANRNIFPDGHRTKHYNERVFRRGTVHYEGIVHNRPTHKGTTLASEIRLYHYGYGLDEETMQRKYHRTRVLLEKQVEEEPDNIYAWMHLVRSYRNLKLYEQAVEAGEGIRESGNWSRSSTDKRQMILYDMAYSLFSLDRHDEAERCCREVLEENPCNLDVQFILGGIYIATGQYQEALGAYQRFLEIKHQERVCPQYTPLQVDTYSYEDRAWNNIGQCHRNVGRLDQAVEAFRKAIAANPQEVVCYNNLAGTYVQQGIWEAAEKVLQQSIDRSVADRETYFRLGRLHQEQGRIDQAIGAYQGAVALDSDPSESVAVEVRHNLGMLLAAQGNLEEAEGMLKEAMERAPAHIGVLLSMATVQGRRGKRTAARRGVEEILHLNPPVGDLYTDLADVCILIEDYPAAIRLLEGYLAGHADQYPALTDLATCYAKLGQYEAALIGYHAALKLKPGYERAIGNLKVLQRRYKNRDQQIGISPPDPCSLTHAVKEEKMK